MTTTDSSFPSALLFPLLSTCSVDRLKKATDALVDGSVTMTLTFTSETTLRALVTNGDGNEYGVTLTSSLTTCSCKDFLYRGGICKHQILTALVALRTPSQPHAPVDAVAVPVGVAPASDAPVYHLVWSNNETVCGTEQPALRRPWPWKNDLPDSCQDCARIHRNGYLKHMTHIAA